MNSVTPGAEMTDESRLKEAVGRNAEYYLPRWQAMESKGSKVSWNWPACLLNLYWFAWRKMWGPWVLLMLAMILLGVAGAAGPRAGQLGFLASIGVSFITGAYGNHLYRRHCRRLVAATDSMAPDQARLYLAKRGGTSAVALVILVVLTALLAALALAGLRTQTQGAAGDEEMAACAVPHEGRWLA